MSVWGSGTQSAPHRRTRAYPAEELVGSPVLWYSVSMEDHTCRHGQPCKFKKLARALKEGDKSGVFRGDATVSVMAEFGLDRLDEPSPKRSRRSSAADER